VPASLDKNFLTVGMFHALAERLQLNEQRARERTAVSMHPLWAGVGPANVMPHPSVSLSTLPLPVEQAAADRVRRLYHPELAEVVAQDLQRRLSERRPDECTICLGALAPGGSVLLPACLHAACLQCVAHCRAHGTPAVCPLCQEASAIEHDDVPPPHPLVEAALTAPQGSAESAAPDDQLDPDAHELVRRRLEQGIAAATAAAEARAARALDASIGVNEAHITSAELAAHIDEQVEALCALLRARRDALVQELQALEAAQAERFAAMAQAESTAHTVLMSTVRLAQQLLDGRAPPPTLVQMEPLFTARLERLAAAVPTAPVPRPPVPVCDLVESLEPAIRKAGRLEQV